MKNLYGLYDSGAGEHITCNKSLLKNYTNEKHQI